MSEQVAVKVKKPAVKKPTVKKVEPQLIEAGAQHEPAPRLEAEEEGEVEDADFRMVKIKIPVTLKIKKHSYHPGIHSVPMHLARTMSEMVDLKRRADISIFVGKNVLVERLMDRTLVQTEVESLDIKKIVNR